MCSAAVKWSEKETCDTSFADPAGQGVTVHSELMVLNTIVLPHKELVTSFKNQIIL